MKSKLVMLAALFLSLAIISMNADARRFGGLTRSYSKPSWSRSAHTNTRATYIPKQRAHSSHASPSAPRKGGFLKGAFMGLLAGGLIGSLLSGHGFSGLHVMDLFLAFGFGLLIFKLISYVRRSQEFRR